MEVNGQFHAPAPGKEPPVLTELEAGLEEFIIK
jgi:hypothetical protein